MSTQSTTSFDEKYAANLAENYERYFVPAIGEPIARHLMHTAGPTTGERVLDIACGTGVATRLAAQAVGRDGRVVGLDANPGMVEVARTVSPDGIEWLAAPVEDMPLPDGAFDLALCSHFLFLYGAQFDAAFHLAALRELCRVAGEARIFPLLDLEGAPSAHLPAVRAALSAEGFTCELRPVAYEFQKGGNEMLKITRPS